MGTAWARVALLLVVAASPLVLASPAAVDGLIVAITPQVDPASGQIGTRGGYANAVAVADVNGTLTFLNLDITAHDVIARDVGPADNPWCARYVGHHECPLFASLIVGLGKQAPVEGTDQLEPGRTYDYYCSIHHAMTGTLVAI